MVAASSQAPAASTVSGLLAQRLLDALPQTQCTRCGYPDCAAYAQAIAANGAAINQCPPGGAEGVLRLAAVLKRPDLASLPINLDHGSEGPRRVAVIDESWCMGCTLCLPACPTDAILGTNKRMHTVIEPYCTGCELCVSACPVDCIRMEPLADPAEASKTGWAAWSPVQADAARHRYAHHQARIAAADEARSERHKAELEHAAADIASHSKADASALAQKRAIVEAALARAKAKIKADTPGSQP